MNEQKLKKLPVGLSAFSELIQENYVYVDKTRDIYQMVTSGKYYFLSRPRRFGKSLLISTLDALFSGKKELFKDLWVSTSDWHWPTHPVIRLDFSAIDHETVDELRAGIIDRLNEIAHDYDLDLSTRKTIGSKFSLLIHKLAQKNSVVILIDEYDKPILDHIESTKEAKAQRAVLKSLFSVIKSTDQYLKFVLLTGVSKFAKTSIFSGINNLRDITLSTSYATLLGYTHQELIDNFAPHLDLLANKESLSQSQLVTKLQGQYNGYCFAPAQTQVFNPYSILTSLIEQDFGDYWFESGTPTFLVKLIESGHYPLNQIYQPIMSSAELGAFEPEKIQISALLYQTGYLTIKQYDTIKQAYILDFPNLEVARSFNFLIARTSTQLLDYQTKTYAAQIAQTVAAQNFDELQQVLQNFFNEMPYTVHVKREFDLQLIIFSVFKLIGIEVDPEVTTSLGRADLVVSFPKFVCIIELKLNKSAQEALEQIKERQYYEKYENTGKKITLLGINFNAKKKAVAVAWHAL